MRISIVVRARARGGVNASGSDSQSGRPFGPDPTPTFYVHTYLANLISAGVLAAVASYSCLCVSDTF